MTAEDQRKLESLRQQNNFSLVFDSLRDRQLAIYRYKILEEQSCLSKSDQQDLYPDVSQLDNSVVFARAASTSRNASAQIYILPAGATTPRLLAEDATFPTFSADGKNVYFERGRRELWRINLASGESELVFPKKASDFGQYAVIKPRVSWNDKLAIFTTDKGGRWHTWCADLTTSQSHLVVKGCEAAWFPESTEIAYIKKYGLLAHVGIYAIDALKPGEERCLQDSRSSYGHEYFPMISPCGRFLAYSACPIHQHDHLSSHYQLFIKNLETAETTRLTFDTYNNRWPKFLKSSADQA